MTLIINKTPRGWENKDASDESANKLIEENDAFLMHYRNVLPDQFDIKHLVLLRALNDADDKEELPDLETAKKIAVQLKISGQLQNHLYYAMVVIEQNKKYFSADTKPVKNVVHHNTPGWSERWRLHIDPKHQIHGPYAYDKGGSAIEDDVGENFSYSANIMGAERYFQDFEGVYDFDFYCQLHAQCMRTRSGELENSKVRDDLIHVRVGAYGSIDSEALESKLTTKIMDGSAQEEVDVNIKDYKRALEEGEYFVGGIRSSFRDLPRDIEMRIKEWFAEFNKEIKEVKTKEAKLYVIANLYKKLECAHPFKDGNGRVNRLLLNGLLRKNGLGETVLSDCACAHFMSLSNIVKEIQRGIEEFRFIQKLSDGMSWQKQNKLISEWEKNHGVKMEYSMIFGEQLQQMWEYCYRLKIIESKLASAFECKDFNELPAPLKEKYKNFHKDDLLSNMQKGSDKLHAIIEIADNFKESYSAKKLRGKALKYITQSLPKNQRAPLRELTTLNNRKKY